MIRDDCMPEIQNCKEIFLNRAILEKSKRICCDNCLEQMIFYLKDDNCEVAIGLITVLECMKFAIENGDLPKVPMSWSSGVFGRLNIDFPEDEGLSYFDEKSIQVRR